MSRKTVGLYKRYKFDSSYGTWLIHFKRPLDWFFGELPSVQIPDDFINDYPDWVNNKAITWTIIMLRDSLGTELIQFDSNISKEFTDPFVNKYVFAIPQPLWGLLKEEGIRKEWYIILVPYDRFIINDSIGGFGGYTQFDIKDCAKRYGGYTNDYVNNGHDDGTLFGWLYGEDYSALYTKWECPVQLPAKRLNLQEGECIILME